MITVNADTVYQAIKLQLETDGIPLCNLISLLADSAAYMRGCHNGFQEKMKKDAPHLINIDGDLCHHILIVKNFTNDLDEQGFLTSFLDDVFNDFKYSADLKDELLKISSLLNYPTSAPLEREPHRWLSI